MYQAGARRLFLGMSAPGPTTQVAERLAVYSGVAMLLWVFWVELVPVAARFLLPF